MSTLSRRTLARCASSLATLALLGGCAPSAPFARAYRIEDLSQAIGGPKALGQPGDYLIENDRIRLVVLAGRNSFGPNIAGGSLVDADLQRDDPRYTQGEGNDQLAEVFSSVNLNVPDVTPDQGTVKILSDGSDGGPAKLCVEGPATPFITLLKGLWAATGSPDFWLRTDYILEPGAPAVKIRTAAVVGDYPYGPDEGCQGAFDDLQPVRAETSADRLDVLGLALQSGAVLGDFYLQGGSVDVFGPNIGFDEELYIHELEEQGINTFEDPIPVDYLAGVGDKVSYGLMPDAPAFLDPTAGSRLFVPMFTSSQTVAVGAGTAGNTSGGPRFADGTVLSYDRWFAVGHGDVGSVVDALLEVTRASKGRVEGHVVEEETGTPISGARVFVYRADDDQRPWSEWTTDVGQDTDPDGSFGGDLPPGAYELLVHQQGRPDGQKVPVTVVAGQTVHLDLTARRPATVTFTVRDTTGQKVPAKVTFYRVDGGTPYDSVLGDTRQTGTIGAVEFAPYGTGSAELPPGQWQAVASRGLEYEVDVSEPFTVSADHVVDLQLQVDHSVDPAGWISADFHVHAEPSFDSGITLADRVITMVCEGMDFFSSSDHDAVTDYQPVIEAMGLDHWARSAVGLEITTIELGHFLGFPLKVNHLKDAGGAIDWTGLTPQEIFDNIRVLGAIAGDDPVVFVGHPRDGILGYFQQYGLDPYSGEPDELVVDSGLLGLFNPLLTSDNFSTDFDAMEVLNAKRFELIRTPTQPELDQYAADLADGQPSSVTAYQIVSRSMQEQQDLVDGVYKLGYGHDGSVDDWFTLMNLGFFPTALGNSDTHSKTHIEAGCPRNYVYVGTNDPSDITAGMVAQAVKAGRVVASYGPFINFYANDESNGPGSMVTDDGDTNLYIEVWSPSWFDVDRVELYQNGTLVGEWPVDTPNSDTLNIALKVPVRPDKDSWYVVAALGDDTMSPVFQPVEIPKVQFQDVVTDALSSVSELSGLLDAVVPIPRSFPILPYAITNAIRVDHDGDGVFTPPGLPRWLQAPDKPADR